MPIIKNNSSFGPNQEILEYIGFALRCLYAYHEMEPYTYSECDWAVVKRQFVLACLSVSGFGLSDRDGMAEKANSCIQEMLRECTGKKGKHINF